MKSAVAAALPGRNPRLRLSISDASVVITVLKTLPRVDDGKCQADHR